MDTQELGRNIVEAELSQKRHSGACRNHHYPARKNARLRVRAFGRPHGDASKNGSNVGNAMPQQNCRSRIARGDAELRVELAPVDDMGERGVGAKLPAQAFRRDELHAVEAVANETWRQIETGESFHAYDAAAVDGISNLAVRFEHADMKARPGRGSQRRSTRPGPRRL